MKLNIFGAGYVGLSQAVFFATKFEVALYDIDYDKINQINDGRSPIKEDLLSRHLKKVTNNLTAYHIDEFTEVEENAFSIICLPTNFNEQLGAFDTSIVETCVKKIVDASRYSPIIVKSTVPIGFTDELSARLGAENLFFSPEFLREGWAMHDCLYPNRIVVGSTGDYAKKYGQLVSELSISSDYKTFYTDSKTAETIKLASNCYLANRVAFFNEIDTLAMKLDLDAELLIHGMCSDPRIGEGYNNPSFGFGGYCLPKDMAQMEFELKKRNLHSPQLTSVLASNKARLDNIVRKVMSQKPKLVGVYRLQMKTGSDNVRMSTSVQLAVKLKSMGIKILIYEPEVQVPSGLSEFVVSSLSEFFSRSDLLVANRWHHELDMFTGSIITRDIYNEN